MSYGRPPPDTESMISLKVDNLTYRTTPEDLRRAFQKYGEVGDVYIPRDRFSRESRGFAFVRFFDERDAEDALDGMDGTILDGRELRVQMARYGRPTEPYRRGPRRYSGGGGRNRGRSYSRSRSRSRSRGYKSRKYSKSRSRSHGSRSRSRSKSQSRSRSRSAASKSVRSSRSLSRSRSPQNNTHENEVD